MKMLLKNGVEIIVLYIEWNKKGTHAILENKKKIIDHISLIFPLNIFETSHTSHLFYS